MSRAVLAVIIAGLIAAPAAADVHGFDPVAVYRVALGDGPRRGPADAPVTIVEFSDFSCRYCNRVRGTLAQLDQLYPGRLRWVFRHMPLNDDAPLAAEASMAAAAQGRFWPMHDRLFDVHGRVDRAAVELIAADLGLDLGRFRADLDAGTYRDRVRADAEAARHLGVAGTPTFFVNGRGLRGSLPLQVFVRILDEELARAEAARRSGVAPSALYDHLVGSGRPGADVDVDAAPRFQELDPQVRYRVGLGLDGHSDGPADAPITVVEWSDFECPFCARNAPTMARLRREYAGRVRVVFRHLPLPMHRNAGLAAEAAIAAAAQGRFWAMHDRIFADPEHLSRAALEAHAGAIGLDLAAFRAALDDRRYRDAVVADAAAGSVLGIDGTPTLFVNGVPVVGAVSWQRLSAVVDAQLAEAERLIAAGVARGDVYSLLLSDAAWVEKGDPSRMPVTATVGVIELGQVDREEAVVAACRSRDRARAGSMAGRLTGEHKQAAAGACAAYGVDLE